MTSSRNERLKNSSESTQVQVPASPGSSLFKQPIIMTHLWSWKIGKNAWSLIFGCPMILTRFDPYEIRWVCPSWLFQADKDIIGGKAKCCACLHYNSSWGEGSYVSGMISTASFYLCKSLSLLAGETDVLQRTMDPSSLPWSLWAVLEDGQGHPSRREAAEREEEVTDILGPGSMEQLPIGSRTKQQMQWCQ